jgi:flagellar motor switch protein FliM
MGVIKSNSILRKKASDGRNEQLARGMSLAKAMRMAVAKAADEVLELAATATSVKAKMISGENLVNILDQEKMLILLEGQNGDRGGALIDVQTMGALIEQQTIGRVIPKPAQARLPTRVDAALAAPLLDDLLDRLAHNLLDEPEGIWVPGYSFGALLEDQRQLLLALTELNYHQIKVELDFGEGAKQGELVLFLPDRKVPLQPNLEGNAKPVEEIALRETVLQAPATLNAVLARVSLPYSMLQSLGPGDTIPIPAKALLEGTLEVGKSHKVARITLGQMNGMRAVRFNGTQAGNSTRKLATQLEEGLSSDIPDSIVPPIGAKPKMAAPIEALGDDDVTTVMGSLGDLDIDTDLDDLSDLDDLDDLDGLALPVPLSEVGR